MLWNDHEQVLLQHVAAGDESAFTALYHRYEAHILQVASLYIKDHDASREIVQEVFRKLWENREKLAAVRDARNYLFIIARNCIFNQFKKAAYEQAAQKDLQYAAEAANDTDYRVRNRECERMLHTAVNSLPPQRKKIYQLAREKGMSYEEIARELSISRFTVKNHMVQALQSIRLYLLQHLHTTVALVCLLAGL
ncbi:RNA polymerase sigma-70 factor [Chitinophaga lutea]|uniref:RNA polymerase sigma-70 factor n=1 Tax=Chitinophaga lutea TaxID=2488634 RepID=A0A3N4Q1S3_9BACT|nr:RNA polymerase sigma-70 factor [Chitinophaga lutea]RPE13515.1 RNA polymerase sigma-70 factor [Chitinophaga lutea]